MHINIYLVYLSVIIEAELGHSWDLELNSGLPCGWQGHNLENFITTAFWSVCSEQVTIRSVARTQTQPRPCGM